MNQRIESALRHYRELRRDRTSNYVCKREVWRLAYWQARVEVK
jgi:hypothetical protein